MILIIIFGFIFYEILYDMVAVVELRKDFINTNWYQAMQMSEVNIKSNINKEIPNDCNCLKPPGFLVCSLDPHCF